MSLRERNRLNAKRAVQRAALSMFRAQGFDSVTVESIAREVGMAPSTVYRLFVTKEDIVLWDEHDLEIDRALEEQLRRHPPLEAMRIAFVETLGGRYDDDIEFQLARVNYIYATERLHAAALHADLRHRVELTDGLRHFLSKRNRHAAPILAGAALLAVDVAIERWQADAAKHTLSVYVNDAFDSLIGLASIT
ncbi:MAG: TetR family transcriptional regulator [Actinobacteria bacterium]|nr:TetR family transcriptional regulator [Actinomycetota bacterium]